MCFEEAYSKICSLLSQQSKAKSKDEKQALQKQIDAIRNQFK